MKFDDWLIENRWDGKQAAEKIGVSQSLLSYIRHGKRRPTAATIERIREFTGGAVTAADFEGAQDAERV